MISLKGKGLMMLVLVVVCACMLTVLLLPTGVLAFVPQPDPPGEILDQLNELKDVIREFAGEYNVLTDTNTAQQANALYNKIDVVIGMVLSGNYMAAAKKLEKDISPKLNICVTTRDRARSWLSNDLDLQPIVEEFESMCQEMINGILIALNRLING